MKKQLVLSKNDYEIKIALLEDARLCELYIENIFQKEIVGNIYKGEVKEILSTGEIIFVDIGLNKNAFLSFEKRKNENKLNVGDKIIVQVETAERDNKGAKLTLDYSLNGENIVLLPNSNNISVSKKIKNEEERARLKALFSDIENGIIIRTASEYKSEAILKTEYENLLEMNELIKKNFKNIKKGLLFDNNELLMKICREIFDETVEEFFIEDEETYLKIKENLIKLGKENLCKNLKRYFKDEKIFEYFKIDSQINQALEKKVWLASGGYLVIEKTEALTSIDVNTGQNTKKSIEKNILNTNLEATKEIVRQLRLRNIAGIIIIDFINMRKQEDRKAVFQELKNNLQDDRVETNLYDFNSLGLIQLTRKRQGRDLAEYFYETCSLCKGFGQNFSFHREILEILERLESELKDEKVHIVASKEIIDELRKIKPDISYEIVSQKTEIFIKK